MIQIVRGALPEDILDRQEQDLGKYESVVADIIARVRVNIRIDFISSEFCAVSIENIAAHCEKPSRTLQTCLCAVMADVDDLYQE